MSDESTENQDPPNAAPRSFTERFLRPKKPQANLSPPEDIVIPPEDRKAAMQTMNNVEQRLGYVAAALAVFMGGLATLIFPHQRLVTQKPSHGTCPPHYSLIKGTCQAYLSNQILTTSIIVLVFAAAIFITVRIRRRIPAVFSSLITGVALSSFGVEVGAPFLIYGGWLMIRARRIQKYGTTDAKEVAGLAGQDRAARKAGKPQPNATPKATKPSSAKATASTPSKRYTPKKPTPRKPTPRPVEEKKPSKWRARLEGLDQES